MVRLLPSVLPALAAAKQRTADAVAIEKPFGTGLASARHLNQILRIQLPEPVIFRVDHFLSDALVRRVIVLRFLYRVFEPTWNAVHVDHVEIGWLESLTLEGRASYYDRAGALKDIVQNHLMEAMALVLMEQPARLDADSFRGTRVEALRAVATPGRRPCAARRSAPATPPAPSGPGKSPPTSMNPGSTRAGTPKPTPPSHSR